jgi:2-methylisocitrate lyase-like PEP mutase family enzyme
VASQADKARAFRALHEGDPFVFPNPWDPGAAKVLAGLGFKALATTSSGFAFTLGRADGNTTLEEVTAHIRALDEATELPVAADLENGYGPRPEDAAKAVTEAAGAGAVGGSIEDWDRNEGRIYDPAEAVERIGAAVEAVEALPFPFTLTARAENHIHGNPNLDDTIERLQAFERAGAHVLFAPGLRSVDEVRAICEAVSRPVNVLGHAGFSMSELVEAGAQRISVGGALTWVAVTAMAEAAEKLLAGDFSSLTGPGRVRDWLAG